MRISTIFISASLAVVVPTIANAQAVDTPPEGYTLRWSDEFNADQLDETNWNIEVNGDGGGNQELQYYRRENVSMGTDPKTGEHCLILTAKREEYLGRKFTSGRVTTQNKAAFKHGVLQARIKFPKTADGLWPAYWMMGNDLNRYGWPRCGEMDIIEMGHSNAMSGGKYAGWQDRYFAGTLHYGPGASNEQHQQYSQEFSEEKFQTMTPISNDEYHILTVEWDGDNLNMYYDLEAFTAAKKRQARYFSRDVRYSDDLYTPGHYFQKPFFFLFNLAVGGWFPGILDANKITALNDANDQQASMYIDWVRVYQKDDDNDAQYTYYDNGENVTNIEKEPEPEPVEDNKTQLSGFGTKALDANGESTFDFSDGYDYVLISTSEGVTGNIMAQGDDAIKANYNVDEQNNFLWIWEGTYVAEGHVGGVNSFGWQEGYNTYYVTSNGWSGMGFASLSDGPGKDLSMIDDTYWLHFAMKGNDPDLHSSHTISVGDASFRVGLSDNAGASIGDFPRNGEWYYFDIPVKALRQFADPIFPTDQVKKYAGNVFAVLSGGVTDAEMTFDNVFFYKSRSKEVPTYTDTADLGLYGYKSIGQDGEPAFSFDQCDEIIPFALTEDVWNTLTGDGTYPEGSKVRADHDYTMQAGRSNFFVWGDPQTFKGREESETVTNSTGIYTGNITSWASASGTNWNGMGFASIDGMGYTPAPKDLTMIDDNWYFHFSLRSDAAVGHVPVSLRLGSEGSDAVTTLGSYSVRPVIGDFPRDGEWYSFDIPVSVLRQYGELWSAAGSGDNGKLSAFKGYNLTFSTGNTFYSGSFFSYDNVFFWKPAFDDDQPDQFGDLGPYGTKSLDANGKSYFDFSKYTDYILVNVGAAEQDAMGYDNIIADLGINDQTTHLWLWEGTYNIGSQSGSVPNSFGNNEGWIDLVVNDKGWTGAGLVSDDGYDVSMIDPSYILHFAVRGTDNSDLNLILGKTHFTIGAKAHVNDYGEMYPRLGDFKRDGEWYSFDIPMTEFFKINQNIFREGSSYPGCFKDNLFVFSNGSHKGDELQMDNIFFYRTLEAHDTSDIDAPRSFAGSPVPQIFDLSGRRVESMSRPGIYIVRSAEGVRKIMVR